MKFVFHNYLQCTVCTHIVIQLLYQLRHVACDIIIFIIFFILNSAFVRNALLIPVLLKKKKMTILNYNQVCKFLGPVTVHLYSKPSSKAVYFLFASG